MKTQGAAGTFWFCMLPVFVYISLDGSLMHVLRSEVSQMFYFFSAKALIFMELLLVHEKNVCVYGPKT